MENGEIGVIDFNRWEICDQYEEFYKLESFARELSIPYCIGQMQAYLMMIFRKIFGVSLLCMWHMLHYFQ